jgi:hypothetical protein
MTESFPWSPVAHGCATSRQPIKHFAVIEAPAGKRAGSSEPLKGSGIPNFDGPHIDRESSD